MKKDSTPPVKVPAVSLVTLVPSTLHLGLTHVPNVHPDISVPQQNKLAARKVPILRAGVINVLSVQMVLTVMLKELILVKSAMQGVSVKMVI